MTVLREAANDSKGSVCLACRMQVMYTSELPALFFFIDNPTCRGTPTCLSMRHSRLPCLLETKFEGVALDKSWPYSFHEVVKQLSKVG